MNMTTGIADAMQEKAEKMTDEQKEEFKWYKKMKHNVFLKRKKLRTMQKNSRRKNRKN